MSALDSPPRPEPAPATPAQKLDVLRSYITSREEKGLLRSSQELQLRLAQELVTLERWDEALDVLRPLWRSMTYRREGWWDVVAEIGVLLRDVARRVGDAGSVVSVAWELGSGVFKKQGTGFDPEKCLDGMEVPSRPCVVVREGEVVSLLTATYAFEHGEGKVGENSRCQICVTSSALEGSESVVTAELKVVYEGGMRPVILRHKAKDESDETGRGLSHVKVELMDGPTETSATKQSPLVGEVDLTFHAGKSKVFEFMFPLREAGEARALKVTFSLIAEKFDLEYIVIFNRTIGPDVWWCQKQARRRLVRVDPHAIRVLPKPPKMDMRFMALQEQYYTNETILLKLDINNNEDEASIAKLSVSIVGDQVPSPPFLLYTPGQKANIDDADAEEADLDLGRLETAESTSSVVKLAPSLAPATYDVIVELSYHLASEPETPISKTSTVRLLIVSPFEANYDFSPDLDLAPWPSFFSVPADNTAQSEKGTVTPSGLVQKWTLISRYASFALSPLLVTSINLSILALNGGITCTFDPIDAVQIEGQEIEIKPKTIETRQFSLRTQKISLDDRRSASLDLSLDISWRRDKDSEICTTALPIRRLIIASSEPRVLVALAPTPPELEYQGLLHLDYVIENPSLHFLTFGLSMTTSDTFAFSGLKTGTVQLLPLSRRRIRIRILPNLSGDWIKPVLVVRDRYFQKVLRVSPCGGLRAEKEGVGVWVPAEEE